MAIGIENYPNLDTTDPANFPHGAIKDNPGDDTGTPVNRLTTNDIHQFFAKMLANAGISANNLAEDETNGYQYIQALMAITNAEWAEQVLASINGGTVTFDKNRFYNVTAATIASNVLILDQTSGYNGNEIFIRAVCHAGDQIGLFTTGDLEVLTGLGSLTMQSDGTVYIHIKMVSNNGISPIFMAWVYNDAGMTGAWQNITLSTGWSNSAGTTAQALVLPNGEVLVKGFVVAGGGAGILIGTLPSGIQPTGPGGVNKPSLTQASGTETIKNLLIQSNGHISFSDGSFSISTGMNVSLDPLSGWLNNQHS